MASKDQVPEKVEEPKITNDKEGGKKQKEATKRLSEYNKEVSARKSKALKAEEDRAPEEDKNPDPEIPAEAPPAPPAPPADDYSIASMGNIIAAIGVGVAALCLYLSYSAGPEEPPLPPPPPPDPEEEKSRKRRVAPVSRAPPKAKPKFKNLD